MVASRVSRGERPSPGEETGEETAPRECRAPRGGDAPRHPRRTARTARVDRSEREPRIRHTLACTRVGRCGARGWRAVRAARGVPRSRGGALPVGARGSRYVSKIRRAVRGARLHAVLLRTCAEGREKRCAVEKPKAMALLLLAIRPGGLSRVPSEIARTARTGDRAVECGCALCAARWRPVRRAAPRRRRSPFIGVLVFRWHHAMCMWGPVFQ